MTLTDHLNAEYSRVFPDWNHKRDGLDYVLTHGDTVIHRHRVRQLYGCGAVLVVSHVWVAESNRGHGVGGQAHSARIAAATKYGAALLLCTAVVGNEPEERILLRHGWLSGDPFTNHNTEHRVRLWQKALTHG